MSKFTKGPWYKSKPKGEHRAFVMCEGIKICTVAYNRGKMNTSANANLIAAAPDMYRFLDDLANGRGVDYPIEKLLAKARGEK